MSRSSGFSGETLFCSLRALAGKDIRAGAVARTISDGHGGGHDTFAAAQVPIVDAEADPHTSYEAVRERFLKEVRAKKSLTRPLTLPPDAKTTVP